MDGPNRNYKTVKTLFEKPRTIVEQIYRGIASSISQGLLKPGQTLREREIQEWFGVSRSPIREAIRLLEADGLVIVDNYKKKYVRNMTSKDFKDISLCLACLEGFVANLATLTLTEKQIDNIQKINEGIRKAVQQENSSLCAELNLRLHKSYVKIISNGQIIKAIRPMTKTIVWFWLTHFYYKHLNLAAFSIDEHQKMIEAFRRKDAAKAEEETRKHIINSHERLLEVSAFDSNGNYIIPSSEETK